MPPRPAALLVLAVATFSLAPLSNAFPYCPCVLFNTTGTFHSPNYPANLENVDCLFYHFHAPPRSMVQITFSMFSLPVRNPV
ncbi:unnamed protein product [Heligmosomoides polygyrus]|uniref:CUB domain-containing protein n=1 Tax=Heligmosomoides polygyrus TaxID=6339 RepID=A0A183FH87_HELPZ|nr:unnamed protein product [Heligmosomoides polygyrus]